MVLQHSNIYDVPLLFSRKCGKCNIYGKITLKEVILREGRL